MTAPLSPPVKSFVRSAAWIPPVLMLCVAYGLLGLTLTEQLSHTEIMQRCVLVDPNLSRIWSVANIEVGLAYLGVFAGMVYYFLRQYHHNRQHLTDLGFATAYLLLSFTLDYVCVLHFKPFVAMLIGDAIVMTFTLVVSRQMWFQRLLGVFVPIIFLTCGFGHFMEGVSYWHLTYPLNVPWTMVTADIGFAVLVNAARFPAFIRGEDVLEQLNAEKARTDALQAEIAGRVLAEEALRESEQQRMAESLRREMFARDVMLAVTGGRLRLHVQPDGLQDGLPNGGVAVPVSAEALPVIRDELDERAKHLSFSEGRRHDLVTAVSEAMMNAVVHASGGTVRISDDGNAIQARIDDTGSGLDWESLPYATLQSGWSSKGTLGMGFTFMALADKVDVLTGPQGTTVILTMARQEPPCLPFMAA